MSRPLQHAARPPISRRAAWIATVTWMAVIFGLSSLPGSAVPSGNGTVAHFGVYAVLGGLLYLSFAHETPDRTRSLVLAVLAASLYGVTDEIHQAFVPGRYPDVVDWGVDTLGALAGAASTSIALSITARHRHAATSTRD